MKRVRMLAMLALTAGAVGGCNRHLNDGVKVVVEGQQEFPASLAGRWKADRQGWEFVFEPDGRISSAVIAFGRVSVVPGRTTTTPTRTGAQATFTPGPWTVYYEPATQELTLRIVMDHVRVPMGENVVEGSSTDVLSGPISSETGVWQVQWTTYTRYTAKAGEGPAADLSTDSTYGETQPLTFTRIENE
jgi:hypothetical protein